MSPTPADSDIKKSDSCRYAKQILNITTQCILLSTKANMGHVCNHTTKSKGRKSLSTCSKRKLNNCDLTSLG